MSDTNTNAVPGAISDPAAAKGRALACNDTKGIAAPSNGKSCLPSLVGAPGLAVAKSDAGSTAMDIVDSKQQSRPDIQAAHGKGSNRSEKNKLRRERKRLAKQAKANSGYGTRKPNSPAGVVNQPNKSNAFGQGKGSNKGSKDSLLSESSTEYKWTGWYKTCLKATFRNKAALDKFNSNVRTHLNDIDPTCAPICANCGDSDLILCGCMITGAEKAVAVIDGGVLATPAATNLKYRWFWLDRVRRAMVWPFFDSTVSDNHYKTGVDKSFLDENSLFDEEMYFYIRQNLQVSYDVNGVYHRESKLAHCKKLASRYLENTDNDPLGNLTAEFTNSLHYTIQRACDSTDDAWLLSNYNSNYHLPFHFAPGWKGKIMIVGSSIAMSFLAYKISKLLIVGSISMVTVSLSDLRNPVSVTIGNVQELLRIHAARVIQKIAATKVSTLNGFAVVSTILQGHELCRTVGTTFWNLCQNVISNLPPILDLGRSIGVGLIVS